MRLFIGASNKNSQLNLVNVVFFLGSAETIRFGNLIDALVYAPFREFYYGGFIAIFLLLLFYVVKD